MQVQLWACEQAAQAAAAARLLVPQRRQRAVGVDEARVRRLQHQAKDAQVLRGPGGEGGGRAGSGCKAEALSAGQPVCRQGGKEKVCSSPRRAPGEGLRRRALRAVDDVDSVGRRRALTGGRHDRARADVLAACGQKRGVDRVLACCALIVAARQRLHHDDRHQQAVGVQDLVGPVGGEDTRGEVGVCSRGWVGVGWG